MKHFLKYTLQPDPRPVFMAHDVDGLKIGSVDIGSNCNQKELLVKSEVNHLRNDFKK